MCWRSTVLLIALLAAPVLSWSDNSTEAEMLWREVESELATIGPDLGFVKLSPQVLEALKNVPRDRFVPEAQQDRAYRNTPLPIGHGQTISQPFIVAIMTELLDPQPGDRVFELGTGSGYQAAVLSRLVAEVYTMEIVAPLGARAGRILADLGYDNVHVRIGDGYKGWPDQAPFDAIVVTAAGDHIPPPLIAQLKPGGRMVMPVGSRFFTQQLVLLEKTVDGAIRTRELLPVAFVPLTGER